MVQAKKIMIVDDEETLTFSLYQSFKLWDQHYEVVTAASGDEAVKKLMLSEFDIVITDISMPGMSGIELLSHIKADFPKTEVIIMTAYGSEEKREEALKNGARYYLEKPFEIMELKELVMKLLPNH
jgi:YesN/AraC family two-component response regulator